MTPENANFDHPGMADGDMKPSMIPATISMGIVPANSLDFRGRARNDTRTEVRAGIQHYLTELLSLRLDYTYVNSDSNVANLFGVRFYDYGRHVISTQLIYDF